MSYTYKDNTDEVLSKMEKAIERGLEAIGMTAEGHAKKVLICPQVLRNIRVVFLVMRRPHSKNILRKVLRHIGRAKRIYLTRI